MAKTYKRETAWASLVYQAAISVFAMFGETAEIITARGVVAGVTALPVFLFAGAAFGMDWAKKQANLFGETQSAPPTPPINYDTDFGQPEPEPETPPESSTKPDRIAF